MTKTRFQVLAVVLLAGILVLVLSHLYAATTSSSPAPQVGRYQLVQGSYTIWSFTTGDAKATEQRDLFLLDTTTGELQRYDVATIGKSAIMRRSWLPAIDKQ